jgi:hypothetical protein
MSDESKQFLKSNHYRIQKTKVMKKHSTSKKLFVAVAIAGNMFMISACKKSSTSTVTVTEQQAAEVASDAVSPSTGGMVSQVSSAATFSNTATANGTVNSINHHLVIYSTQACGVLKDTTATYTSVSGATPSFSYQLAWQNSLACTVPTTFNCAFQGQGNYSGSFLTSSFASTGTFTLSGLSSADSSYTFNSNFQRQGTSVSKVGAQNTFSHSLTITSSNIVYNKTLAEITSGTATIGIVVTSSSGNAFTYNGTITFLGNKTAKLVLNSGTAYTISWL